MTIKIGDSVPDVKVTRMDAGSPQNISLAELMGSGKSVLFGVPGAFTPTCSARHLPGFIDHADSLREAGIETIACIAVNDIFVMSAWGEASKNPGSVLMLADGNGDAAKAMGLTMDASGFGMGTRCQRFCLVAEQGVVSHLFVDAGGEFKLSSAEHLMDALGIKD